MHVAIIGPGLMGSQIACEYALGGHDVTVIYRRRDLVEQRLDNAWQVAAKAELASDDQLKAARERISLAPGLDAVTRAPDLVVESVVEDVEAKIAVFKDVASRWPNAILASNTSAIPITKLGEGAGAPERTVGTHYWNPPLLMPLVEVISGERTSPDVVSRTMDVLRALGKRPMHVRRDVTGFLWNRLQLALLREAVWIVEQGVADRAVVDEVVRNGLARRWRQTGPFETMALGGPDTFARVAALIFPELSNAKELRDPQRLLNFEPGELEAIRQRRDAGLIEELRRDWATGQVARETASDGSVKSEER